ncbi:hypothetical protein HMPREF1129_1299 [Actinomyces naeslundii str. Howell 279]|uniref:Uncharacterized protein n=1 Tax=Actinomyces naeslundii (strain ATCC 12104 / DSM 43013 / CCUG 2238 / JCM 8349 / NCTC 10301 / Howell 279) TaxID=1115803 RepID=J3JIS8_ACTNH|nr:hypothetical protein HMPREF1129_1299 [Actinomyces naeslundii str. Howell 279]
MKESPWVVGAHGADINSAPTSNPDEQSQNSNDPRCEHRRPAR